MKAPLKILHAAVATAIVIISLMTIIGYLVRMETLMRWTIDGPPMALNTAVAFLLVGLAEIVESIRDVKNVNG